MSGFDTSQVTINPSHVLSSIETKPDFMKFAMRMQI